MLIYSILDDSQRMVRINTTSYTVNSLSEEFTPHHSLYKIKEGGEFDGQYVDTDDYVLVLYSYRLRKHYYKIIKKDSEWYSFYNNIETEHTKMDYPEDCILNSLECESAD